MMADGEDAGGGNNDAGGDPLLQQQQRNDAGDPLFHDHSSEEEEEEEECRVCRGPAEEGHPLYQPCRCRGTIGLTHQDCLQSWLNVQHHGRSGGGSRRCELCHTPFRFSPVYAPDTPDRLSALRVAGGLAHCLSSRWLPFVVRSSFCLSLWLLVAPLLTGWLYQAWMHRPYAIVERLAEGWTLLKCDLVSGAVVLAVVVVSFLSLMSFADFLRVEINHRGMLVRDDDDDVPNPPAEGVAGVGAGAAGGAGNGNNNRGGRDRHLHRRRQGPEEPRLDPQEGDIDNDLWIRSQRRSVVQNSSSGNSTNNSGVAAAAAADNSDDDDDVELDPSDEMHHLAALERELDNMEQPESDDESSDDENYYYHEGVFDDEDDGEEEEDDDVDEDIDEDDAASSSHGSLEVPGDDDDDDEGVDDEVHRRADDLYRGAGGRVLRPLPHRRNNNEDRRREQEELDDDDDDDEILPLQPFERELERQFLNPNRGGAGGRGGGRNNDNNAGNQPQPRGPQRQGFQRNDALLDRNNLLNADQPPDDNMPAPPLVGDLMGEEPMDMDINIALDELLGIRGPINGVVRNLCWLLAFNTVYLGFFAFTPRVVGMAVTSLFFNSTNVLTGIGGAAAFDLVNGTVANATEANAAAAAAEALSILSSGNSTTITTTVMDVLRAVEAESEKQNTTFRLSVLISVGVGYLACAVVVLFLRCLWIVSRKVHFFRGPRGTAGNHHHPRLHHHHGQQHNPNNHPDADEVRDALDEINRIMMLGNNAGNDVNGDPLVGADEQGVAMSFAIGVALDIMTAIVKVGVLLLLKMFLLPIALGVCLDASTLSLFGSTLEDRVQYAGRDLFSFTLLHWVAGITFMLLVTVSVLQLREVAHPKLLAQVIRPQEPQPDLLGNLMNESVTTHAKRMVLSLVIYAALLSMHVYIPIRLLVASGAATWLPFLQVKVSYLMMPQLQVPLELLFFHLCMLGILEKNKNTIGEMQHHWLKLMCRYLGFANSMLPRTVAEFKMVGVKRIYLNDAMEMDPFWYDLAKTDDSREETIRKNLSSFEHVQEELFNAGETKANGERVLRFGSEYIRLPVGLPGRVLLPAGGWTRRSVLLPTKMGRYRLKRNLFSDSTPVFQLWEEVPGEPIPRPPAGWDDLGAGGADVQGRWAWGRERKSTLERGVSCRTAFYNDEDSSWKKFAVSCKMLMLILLSWMTTTVSLIFLVLGPLAIGRFFYYILRFQDKWIHDPFAFAIGSMFFFPLLRNVLTFCTHESLSERLGARLALFRPPPAPKLMVLVTTFVVWGGLAPLLLGWVADIGLIKSTTWFMGEEPWIDTKSNVLNWLLGNVLLGIWLELCVAGVLTRGFWDVALDGGAVQQDDRGDDDDGGGGGGDMDEDGPAGAAQGFAGGEVEGERSPGLPWQGPRGRAAAFVDVWASSLHFEWDKIDHRILMSDVALPILRALCVTLWFPVMALLIFHFWQLPVLTGVWRVSYVRGVLLLTVLMQAARTWQEQVFSWFEAAHRAARDDRYLIGEVLMNHNQEQPTRIVI